LTPQRRTAQLERASSPDGTAGAIVLALSSEEPIARYFGTEILSHDAGAVDLTRATPGLALLMDHDPCAQVGIIEDLVIGGDRKLRGTVRWSRSAEAQTVKADVEDGIRTGVSIGYQITEWTVDETNQANPIYRATRWMPLEGSLVAIPADVTVGVGRSADDAATPSGIIERVKPEVRMSEVTIPAAGAPPAADTRVADLEALAGTGLPDPTLRPFAQSRMSDWLRKGTSVSEARIELYDEVAKRHNGASPVGPKGPELSAKEFQRYSITRALKGLLDPKSAGFESEVSRDLSKAYGRETAGVFLPWQVQASAFAGAAHAKRANELTVATNSAGGFLKFTDYAGFIDLFRERLVTLKAGTQYLPGLRSDFQWVRKTSGSTGSWQATEITNQANSAWALTTITLQPKIYQDSLIASRKMIEQSEEAFEPLIRNEIAQNHAVAVEKAVLAGTGASGQPTGISVAAGTGASAVGGTNGLAATLAHLMAIFSDVTSANVPADNFSYITHPLIMAKLVQTQRFTSTDTPLWDTRRGDNGILGMPSYMSGAVPSALTKGSSTDVSYIYGGDFSQSVLGEWASMQLVVDPYSLGPSQVKLSSIQMVDVALLYPTAFSIMKDARPV